MVGPVCHKCQNAIPPRTPVASYENKTYHPQCLTCKMCNKSVSGQRFLKDENQNFICENCDSLYGPKCARCHGSFKPGQPYKKLDDNVFYHHECFTCFGPCKKPIGAEFYDLDENKFLCTECYDKYGVKSNYDDIHTSAGLVQAVMSTKPPDSFNQKHSRNDHDEELNKLSSTFSTKLNTTSVDTGKSDQSRPNRSSRFDNSPKSDNTGKKVLSCEKCGLTIQGAYSVYNEKCYHTKCFVCSKCQKEFKERQFFKIDDLPVCAECHENNLLITSTRCKKCRKPILDTVLTFMNEEYHEYCLTCTSCNCKLIGASIYANAQKLPYCVDCYTKKESKKCEKCSKPIAPNQSNIIFEEKPYHKECFICDSCKRQISVDETFFKGINDTICCEDCANR